MAQRKRIQTQLMTLWARLARCSRGKHSPITSAGYVIYKDRSGTRRVSRATCCNCGRIERACTLEWEPKHVAILTVKCWDGRMYHSVPSLNQMHQKGVVDDQ